MERVFKAVPADLRIKMEALVQDLTNALEESSRAATVRRRWGLRRRAHSTGNLMAPRAGISFTPISNGWMETLRPGYEEPWSTWKSPNRLQSGVGRSKNNMKKWGLSEESTLCACGDEQTMAYLLNCNSCPIVCTMQDLVKATPNGRDLPNYALACHKTQSDDSSSSMGEPILSRDKGLSSLHQSDSDDIGSTAGVHRHLAPFSLKARQVAHLHGNFESDSFNENFSPVHPNTRRKRKFKRMAVDPVEPDNPSTSQSAVPIPLASSKKKRIIRHSNCENRLNSFLCGKRKRSMRERSVDCEPQATTRSKTSRILAIHKMSLGNPEETRMEGGHCEMMSSSSLSSSESDTGIYTNDEGREGDDEQSDWFGEPGKSWWEDDSQDRSRTPIRLADEDTDREDCDPAFQAILAASFEHLSEEAKQTYKARVQWLREGLSGREIRAGRRRIRNEHPGFSIVTSANEKLSRFLQDPGQSELRLHPMKKQEREQLCQLANLYSLNMTNDPTSRGLTCPVLTKTRNTMRAVRVEQLALGRFHARHHLSDFKRRRKTPPIGGPPPQPMELVGASAGPIPETNVGNQMLRNMGWEPGTGLGLQKQGIQEPVTAAQRPKLQGLGHNPNYKSS